MRTAAEQLRRDSLVEGAIGFAQHPEERAQTLWQQVLSSLVQVYGLRHPGWRWDRRSGVAVIDTWRRFFNATSTPYITLAPIENLGTWNAAKRVSDRLVIRPLTDEDRQRLWRNFGPHHNPSTIAPTLEDLERWTLAVEHRWEMSAHQALNQDAIEPAVRLIENLICAVRLQQPAALGARVFWTWPDPPELLVFRPGQELLYASDPSARFLEGSVAAVGPRDSAPLRKIMRALETATDRNLQLALRRFDSAFHRAEKEDALIDLWVAFEALLVPDGSAELSYRAALRIALLAGVNHDSRRLYFTRARRSYGIRSKIVHGEHVPEQKLQRSLIETRELAREVLKAWLLNPPSDGAVSIDDALLR
jgi:hypothetical protein